MRSHRPDHTGLTASSNVAAAANLIKIGSGKTLTVNGNVAIGSGIQIALFVAPLLVFASLFLGPTRLTLGFEPFELVSIALSVAVLSLIASDGESNWYEGALLVMVYLIVAIGFYFHP